MKKVALFATLVLALAMSAGAQTLIDFTNLPSSSSPVAIPANYQGLNWNNMDAVAQTQWSDAGPGFFTGNEAMVAFGGGPLCFPNYGGAVNDGSAEKHICESTISVGVGPTALPSFRADKAVVASGWLSSGSIVVTAYNNGTQVGQKQYNLTTTASQISFPSAWGSITELVIHPSPLGSFVLYTFQTK